MMVERGIDASYEMLSRWVDKFGLTYAKKSSVNIPLRALDKRLCIMAAFGERTSIPQKLAYARCTPLM